MGLGGLAGDGGHELAVHNDPGGLLVLGVGGGLLVESVSRSGEVYSRLDGSVDGHGDAGVECDSGSGGDNEGDSLGDLDVGGQGDVPCDGDGLGSAGQGGVQVGVDPGGLVVDDDVGVHGSPDVPVVLEREGGVDLDGSGDVASVGDGDGDVPVVGGADVEDSVDGQRLDDSGNGDVLGSGYDRSGSDTDNDGCCSGLDSVLERGVHCGRVRSSGGCQAVVCGIDGSTENCVGSGNCDGSSHIDDSAVVERSISGSDSSRDGQFVGIVVDNDILSDGQILLDDDVGSVESDSASISTRILGVVNSPDRSRDIQCVNRLVGGSGLGGRYSHSGESLQGSCSIDLDVVGSLVLDGQGDTACRCSGDVLLGDRERVDVDDSSVVKSDV